MVQINSATRLTFADKLQRELKSRDMGARTLARLVDPIKVEQARSTVRRYLKGLHVPTQASRDQITDALGLERGSLDPDPDEEEDPAVLLRRDLDRKVQRALDEHLRLLASLARQELA